MPEQREGFRIILADGTTIEDARASLADGFFWMYIPGITIQEATEFAFDPEKMSKIRYQHGQAEEEYDGYITPYHLMTNPSEISVCMTKAVSE